MSIPGFDRAEYYSRIDGLLSDAFHSRTVVIIGCGAGSYMAEKLARLGPKEIRLVDFDTVELHNLTRTSYLLGDVGHLKVDSLAQHLAAVNPLVDVEAVPADLCAMNRSEQERLVANADLIVAGTDHFPAQALVNRLSQEYRIPALFIGIHAGARGGRIVWSVPGETSCYRCVARDRYEAFESSDGADTDLVSEQGLVVDCQFIDMIALKILIAILERGQDTEIGNFYRAMAGRNEIIVRTSPRYEYGRLLWDAVLSDLPGEPKDYATELKESVLFSCDTVWLGVEPDPDCPDCGARAN